ncbi:MAG: rod shape-determining protein MreD [Peptococcaceae bacterium]|nr:rod shape-determining protein MreD [Peptococcaceae bacterium]
MRFSVFVLLMAGALFLQTTVLDFISVYGVKPDLVMLLVIFNGFLLGTREGAFLGFVAGILEDLFAGSYIGLNAISKMTAGYLAGVFGAGFYKENTVIASAVTFLSTAAALALNYLLVLFMHIYVPPFYALLRVVLPVAAYTALLTPLVYGWFIRHAFEIPVRDL